MDFDEKVMELDRARRAAMVEADLAALERLLSDELVLVHASARADTKETFLSAVRVGAVKYLSVDVRDEFCRRLGDVAAVLGGISLVSGEVDGVFRNLINRYSIVWHLSEKGWQVVHWQSTAVRETP
ncbi:nuclear transport factor 2 family protein [Nocardia vinacea]|uniref:nuclear transport factor 2 family protein n=1 Tax=Nocardia vinacea TaxID=96468 RepID=UPI0034196FF4